MISESIQGFLKESSRVTLAETAGTGSTKIHSEVLTSKAGKLYEKIRYLVDYQDESSVRRNAMARILNRMLTMDFSGFDGRAYLEELVHSGYLPNDVVSEEISEQVESIIRQFPYENSRSIVIKIAACELEAFLFPDPLGVASVDAMYRTVVPMVKFEPEIPEIEGQTHVYIACARDLLKYDDAAISWLLWKWRSTQGNISSSEILSSIAHDLSNPLGEKLSRALREQTIFFRVLRRIAVGYGTESEKILTDHKKLEQAVRLILSHQYDEQSLAMRSASQRAIGYVLLTKVLLALAIEVPVDRWISGELYYPALLTNILFPPILLFLMTRGLDANVNYNVTAISHGIESVINGTIEPIRIKTSERKSVFHGIFYFAYFLLGIVVFGSIAWGLSLAHFNVASISLFMLFLALVSYFGYRIRRIAKHWTIAQKNPGIIFVLADLAFLPIVRSGRWLSRRFSSVNIFVLLLDYFIETPFKMLLRFSDAFLGFLKEKRDQIS